jgi:hypothetical protein
VLLKDFHQIVVIALQFVWHWASLAVRATMNVLIAMTQEVDVVFFGPASHPVAATGTGNPNGLQQEPELLTIPGL